MLTGGLVIFVLTAPAALAFGTRSLRGAIGSLIGQVGLLLILSIALFAAQGLVPFPSAPGVLTVPLALGLAGFFVFILGPFLMAFPARLGLRGFEGGMERLASVPLPALACAIVLGAIAEEVLYRAIGFELLITMTGSAVAASAITVGVFALAHVPLWGVGVSLTILISGGVLTLIYALTKDIWALMLAHVLTDMAGLILPRLKGNAS